MKDPFPQLTETMSQNLPHLNTDTLRQRESMESDPDAYTTAVYLPHEKGHVYKKPSDRFNEMISGFIDFRNTAPSVIESGSGDTTSPPTDAKNSIWVGNDHRTIMEQGARFSFDENLNDYIIGLKLDYDRQRRRMTILKDKVGQSCQRTEEHMQKVIDAAEIALNRDLVEHDQGIQKQFFLEDYGLSTTQDMTGRVIYLEGETVEELVSAEKTKSYDLILLSAITEDAFIDQVGIESLKAKIEQELEKLSSTPPASIRIPYKITTKTEDSNEVYEIENTARLSLRELESSHPGILSELVQTRKSHRTDSSPEETYGYILITRDFQ